MHLTNTITTCMLSANAENMIPVGVVDEMVYVLSKVYKIDCPLIAQIIEGIADINDGLVVNSSRGSLCCATLCGCTAGG